MLHVSYHIILRIQDIENVRIFKKRGRFPGALYGIAHHALQRGFEDVLDLDIGWRLHFQYANS